MTDKRTQPEISAGAGIAISGIWLASAAIAVTAVVTLPSRTQLSGDDLFFTLLILVALPLTLAYWITKVILGRDS